MTQPIFHLLSYCLTNIATTIRTVIKLQGAVTIVENGTPRHFYHPFMQTWLMIVGETLCFIYYLFFVSKKPLPSDKSKPKAKIQSCLIPLFLDLASSVLIFIAMNYLSGSVYSMMSSAVVVFAAIFSRIILKTKLTTGQFVGGGVIVVGAVLAGVGQSFGDSSNSSLQMMILGSILLLVALIMQGIQVPIIQKIYAEFELHPLLMVGWQGLIGTVIWTLLIVLLSYIGCPFAESQCVLSETGEAHIQQGIIFFEEITDRTYLLGLSIAYILVVARFNLDLNTVILKTSAVTLCVLRIFSNTLVWIIGLLFTIFGSDNDQFNLESTDITVNIIKAISLILVTLGLMIYNGIIFKKLQNNEHRDNIALVDTSRASQLSIG